MFLVDPKERIKYILKRVGPRRDLHFFFKFILFLHTCYICVCFQLAMCYICFAREHM